MSSNNYTNNEWLTREYVFGYPNKVEGESVLLEHIPLIQQKEF
jgi:hypothetical protein